MGISVYPTPTASVNPVSNYWLEVAKGNIANHSLVHKFGRNDGVPNGTWEGVLLLSTSFTWLTTATTVRVKSGGDANDTAAGTGAQAITVEGLDQTGAEASEDIELAGASASSATTTTFIRVFRAYIADGRAGTYTGANTGNIVVENGSGGTDLIQISAGEGQSQYCAYTIPLGYTGYLLSALVQADAAKAADFRLYTRENILDTTTPFSPARLKFFWDGILGPAPIKPNTALQALPALTDIYIEARGGGAVAEVAADMEILLVAD
jgi:hypothetical protein